MPKSFLDHFGVHPRLQRKCCPRVTYVMQADDWQSGGGN